MFGVTAFQAIFLATLRGTAATRGMSRVRLALILAVAACGGSSPEPEKPSPQPAARTADLVPMCQRIFARKATCADDYLPALLDLRVELNMPPGIGDEVKTQGRDAILAIAHTELARDTEPAKVDALCETTATKMVANLPPERVHQLLERGNSCEATTDCKAFAVCAVSLDRGFISRAYQQAATSSPQ